MARAVFPAVLGFHSFFKNTSVFQPCLAGLGIAYQGVRCSVPRYLDMAQTGTLVRQVLVEEREPVETTAAQLTALEKALKKGAGDGRKKTAAKRPA